MPAATQITAHPIITLRRNVTREQALRAFSGATLSNALWRMRVGPLQRIAEAYVPFAVYTARYELRDSAKRQTFAMDVVNGSLDLFEVPRAREQRHVETIATINCLSPALSENRADEFLRGKLLRLIFQQGFFKVREPKLEITREAGYLYIPYWLGFYGNGTLNCRVMDAVRRRFEGAKARTFFEEWLAA